MENTMYKVEATVDLKWLGLFKAFSVPKFDISIDDFILGKHYLPAEIDDEDILVAMITENTVLLDKGFEPRYALHVTCETQDASVLYMILEMFADQLHVEAQTITYTF